MLPVGLSDSVSLSGDNPMKLFCPRCRELYDHNVPGGNYIDGAFFGSTFPHLFLQTYSELRPQRCTRQYIPRVFGFKVHQGVRAAARARARRPPPISRPPPLARPRPARPAPHADRVVRFRSSRAQQLGAGSSSSAEQPQLEEWPKRPKNEPVSDWDS